MLIEHVRIRIRKGRRSDVDGLGAMHNHIVVLFRVREHDELGRNLDVDLEAHSDAIQCDRAREVDDKSLRLHDNLWMR